MNVNSVNNLPPVDSQLSVDAVGAALPPAPPPGGEPGSFGSAATASISGPGRMFHELKQLHDSDPAKFKQVVSDMASTLRADAKNAQGDEATRLSGLADRLDKVAQSGSLSDLAPNRGTGGAEGAHHGHHGHHGGHGGGGRGIMGDVESAFSSALGGTSSGSTSTDTTTDTAQTTTAST